MATEVELLFQGISAKVSSNGELLTRAFDYSEPAFQNMNVDNTAFNFQLPRQGEQFVITGAVISGNRDIGVNGAITLIYEATSLTETTVVETLLEVEVPKNTVFPFVLPNVLVSEGAFVNGKTDDNSVRVALYGYFVPTVPS